MRRRGQWGWPVALALAAAGGAWITASVVLWRISALLILLVVCCWIYSRLCLRGLSCQRRLPLRPPVTGDGLRERITLVNRGPWPVLWAEITALGDLPGYRLARVCSLGPRGRDEWSHVTPCLRRGSYELGGLIAQAGDPFGLFVVSRWLGSPASLVVLPRPVRVQTPPLVALGGMSSLDASLPTRGGERTVLLRPATATDRPSHIAWPPSLRTGTLLARQEEAGSPAGVRLIVDLARSAENAADDGEGVAGVAAYLVHELVRAGHAVGLVCGGGDLVNLPAACGVRHATRLWEALALAPTGDAVGLEDLLKLPAGGLGLAVISRSPHARDLLALAPRGLAAYTVGGRAGRLDARAILVVPP